MLNISMISILSSELRLDLWWA